MSENKANPLTGTPRYTIELSREEYTALSLLIEQGVDVNRTHMRENDRSARGVFAGIVDSFDAAKSALYWEGKMVEGIKLRDKILNETTVDWV